MRTEGKVKRTLPLLITDQSVHREDYYAGKMQGQLFKKAGSLGNIAVWEKWNVEAQ